MTKNDAVFTPEYYDVEDFAPSHMSRVEMMQMLDNIKHLKAHVVEKIEADIEMARLCDMPLTIRTMDFSLPE